MKYSNLKGLLVALPLLISCGGTSSDAGKPCDGVACLPRSATCNELSWREEAIVETPVGNAPGTSGGTLVDGTYDVTRMLVWGGNPKGAAFFGTFELKGSSVSAYVGGRDASGVVTSNSASGVWLKPGASSLRFDWTCNNDPNAAGAEAYTFDANGSLLTLVPSDDTSVQAVFLERRATR